MALHERSGGDLKAEFEPLFTEQIRGMMISNLNQLKGDKEIDKMSHVERRALADETYEKLSKTLIQHFGFSDDQCKYGLLPAINGYIGELVNHTVPKPRPEKAK